MILSRFIFVLALVFSLQSGASGWKFIHDLQVPPGTKYQETVVGGLSALFKFENSYYALSDDRGKINEPRIYRYQLTTKAKGAKGDLKTELIAEPQQVIFLKDSEGKALIKMSIDPEGLVVLKDGSFLVTSEGNVNSKPRQAPQLLHFAKDGKLQKEIPLADHLLPELTGEAKKGIRNNLGPEGLTLSPSGKYLYMAIENVLVQDGEETSYEKEGMTRVFKYKIENEKDLVLESEKLYPMSKVTHPKEKALLLGTGVSEIKALDDDTLLFLERSASQTDSTVINEIKLFKVDFKSGDDIKGQASITGKNSKPLTKSLTLDLDQVVKEFTGVQMLDNMEALEFGPNVNGKPTLIVLSDDNFLAVERSLWILLQLPEKM